MSLTYKINETVWLTERVTERDGTLRPGPAVIHAVDPGDESLPYNVRQGPNVGWIPADTIESNPPYSDLEPHEVLERIAHGVFNHELTGREVQNLAHSALMTLSRRQAPIVPSGVCSACFNAVRWDLRGHWLHDNHDDSHVPPAIIPMADTDSEEESA